MNCKFSSLWFSCTVTFHAPRRSSCWIFLFVAVGTNQKNKQRKDAKKTLREYQFRFVRASLLHSRLFVLFIAIQNGEVSEKTGKSRGEQKVKQNDEQWMLRKGQIKHLLHLSDILARFLTFQAFKQHFASKTLNLFSFSCWILWKAEQLFDEPNWWFGEFVRHVVDLDFDWTKKIFINTLFLTKVKLFLLKTFHLKRKTN